MLVVVVPDLLKNPVDGTCKPSSRGCDGGVCVPHQGQCTGWDFHSCPLQRNDNLNPSSGQRLRRRRVSNKWACKTTEMHQPLTILCVLVRTENEDVYPVLNASIVYLVFPSYLSLRLRMQLVYTSSHFNVRVCGLYKTAKTIALD